MIFGKNLSNNNNNAHEVCLEHLTAGQTTFISVISSNQYR